MKSHRKFWLVAILVVAACIRLYALDRGDPLSDETLYGFRAIGMLDFDFAPAQPSVPQIFAMRGLTIPSWTHLSFHDHPLLVFFVQHVFLTFFGANLWGMRLSSAFFGVASVFLVYLIGKKMFSEKVGLIASAFMMSNVLMLYVSRTGIQESQVIFFILLATYCFIEAQRDDRYYVLWGASFGLALLSKYTAIYMALPFVFSIVVFNRSVFKKMFLYAGAAAGLIIFSPAIIYNIYLYTTLRHFDFQLFYIFGQRVAYWKDTPGKEIGSLVDRLLHIPINLWIYDSPLFIVFIIVALITTIATLMLFRKNLENRRNYYFLLVVFMSALLFFLLVGPSPRFLTLLIPWATLLVGVACVWFWEKILRKRAVLICTILLICAIGWEIFFSVNSYVLYRPVGIEQLTYSDIHWDMHPWGFNKLDTYVENIIAGKYPSLTIPYNLSFLEDVKIKAVESAKNQGLKPAKTLFVYNANMSDLASLWVLSRHALYEAWPMISTENYLSALTEKGENFYRDAGFEDIYFIQNTDQVLRVASERLTSAGDDLEQSLQSKGIAPESIMGQENKTIFKVYHFH